jgi:photosystem II stability/assembly factor-like uncharacterized protein
MYDIDSQGDNFYIAFRSKADSKPFYAKSVYGGKKWLEANISRGKKGTPRTIAVDPDNKNTLYIGGYFSQKLKTGFVYKSNDGGNHWELLHVTEKSDYINDIFIDPSDSKIIVIGSEKGIYRSADGGMKWDKVFDQNTKSIYITGTGSIYTGSEKGIYCSEDGGENWSIIAKSENDSRMSINYQDINKIVVEEQNNILYAATMHGLLKFNLK